MIVSSVLVLTQSALFAFDIFLSHIHYLARGAIQSLADFTLIFINHAVFYNSVAITRNPGAPGPQF
jgi:hypothetical protein